jgi:hypothetical protein
MSAALEAEVRHLLARLNEDADELFECPCALSRRLARPGWDARAVFEALSELWLRGEAVHVNGKWQLRDQEMNRDE